MLLQRPFRGSRVSSFYPVKSLPPLSALDSAFQLQEYISLLIRRDVHDVDAIVSLPERASQKDPPDSFDSPDGDAKKPDDSDRKSDIPVDKACWIYEQLRRLAQDLSHPLITMLQQECTRSSCPQMKAGEWLYLCVAHGNDGAMEQCCAIDYILHTVDSATALLNSPRAFPSRLSIPQTSHRHFASLARRLGRIFAHAYFHHREAFEQAEAESSLYARFLKLTNQFDLVPAEFLVIPESAVHRDDKAQPEEVEPPRLFSAAVHPTQKIQSDPLMSSTAPDVDHVPNVLPKPVDAANNFGTDSPRKVGRSRTDTMVFSEGFNAVEELSRTGDSGLLSTSPLVETQSLVAEQPWADLETRTEDLDDEDIGDARSEVTLAGSLSPPVEALSLVSLEDSTTVPTSDDVNLHDAPLEPPSEPPPLFDPPATETSAEEPAPVVNIPEDGEPPGEPTTSVVAEPSATDESIQTISGPEENVAEIADENSNSPPLPNEELVNSEPHAESKLSLPPEPLLELNEPPPSESTPPESESDITDEVGGHGDEVTVGGEEAVVGE